MFPYSDDLIGLFDSPLEATTDPTTQNPPGLVPFNSTPLLPTSQDEAMPLAIMDAPLSQSISFQLPAEVISHPVVPGWDKKVLSCYYYIVVTVPSIKCFYYVTIGTST